MDPHAQIRELVVRVRRRWRQLMVLRGATRGALACAGVLSAAAVLAGVAWHTPLTLAVLGLSAILLAGGALVWGLWPSRVVPSDTVVARFIEEHEPSLDDRLVSAIDQMDARSNRAGFSERLLADAARRVSAVDPTEVVPGLLLRRATMRSLAAGLLVVGVMFFSRHAARESLDAAALVLFPSEVTLDVTPGSTKIPVGSALTVQARLGGNRAPVTAELWRAPGEAPLADGDWTRIAMGPDAGDRFTATLEAIDAPFSYRVVVGAFSSPIYRVAVSRAPRVERIEVEYRYPPALGLQTQIEEDGGDIYAPAGTDVRLRVFTDGPAERGALALAGGAKVELAPESGALSGSLTIVADSSYRVSLVGEDGLSSSGDTEYFIRTIEDRPPEVRLVTPGRDRDVTRLEEVEIETEAEDDFGIERLDLVYSVGGGRESVVPLDIQRHAPSVSAKHLLYLENLEIAPGDFVSYYVRARDVPRGRRSSETRSDIFFLQVRPFDQEFTPTRSQAAGGGGTQAIDDLVSSQKEIIVATWKLDRRAQASKGAQSSDDVKTVARAEAELKRRVEQAASASRASNMRDPRRRSTSGGPVPPGGPRAARQQPEEEAMGAAAEAMGRAVVALDGLKTREAVAPEMEALNQLLKAQSEVKERQVNQQQAGNGAGTNRAGEDLSGLFDRELQRQQRTNYETPTTTERRENQDDSTLDRVRELARRQDELLRQQQDLARRRDRLAEEELKRELERLTREQAELSRQVESLARRAESNKAGEKKGQANQKPGSNSGQASEQMRSASGEMRSATSDLRRQDPAAAAERSARALQGLRETERQLRGELPDERRRALGEMQLEARQLAEQQRQVGAEAERAGTSAAGRDRLRQLAGEQERLAERAQRLERQLSEQGKPAPSGRDDGPGLDWAAAEAARELERGRVAERMRQAAAGMRQNGDGSVPRADRSQPETERAAQSLEGVADRLAAALGPRDDATRQLGESLARAGQLQDQINRTAKEIERLDRQARERGRESGQSEGQSDKGQSEKGQSEKGQPEAGGQAGDAGRMARLRDEYAKQLEQAQELLDRLRKEDSTSAKAGRGFTFEGQGMTLSAPGTEAFKQDFGKWDDLRKQATQALERAATSLSQKLAREQARDRLAAGIEDKAPAEYERQVENYFKAIASERSGRK